MANMQSITTTKTKIIGLTVATGLLVFGAGFGARVLVTSDPVAYAAPVATASTSTRMNASTNDTDAAMVVSAVDNYLEQNNVQPGTNKVTHLQIDGNSARGKLVNSDSGSVFYAHKDQDVWTIVYSGQTSLSQSVATQYNFPAQWVGQTVWTD